MGTLFYILYAVHIFLVTSKLLAQDFLLRIKLYKMDPFYYWLSVSVLYTIFFAVVFWRNKRISNFPPGPIFLPYFGSDFTWRKLILKLGSQYDVCSYLSKIYKSTVIGLKSGDKLTVAISGYDDVKKALIKPEFMDKPICFVHLRRICKKARNRTNKSKDLKEPKKYLIKGKLKFKILQVPFESLIIDQVNDTMNLFETKIGQEFRPDITSSVLKVLWNFTSGNIFPYENTNINTFIKLIKIHTSLTYSFGVNLVKLPMMKFFAPKKISELNKVNQILVAFIKETIKKHKGTFVIDKPTSDLMFYYLKCMELTKNIKGPRISEKVLLMVCLDLFKSGATSTTSILNYAISILSRNKVIQNKIYEEIDTELKNNKFPCITEHKRLPYLKAFITEVCRVHTVGPVTCGIQKASKDTTFNGFFIPKNTTILLNVVSANNDPKHWDNPEKFLPERFLKNGKYTKDETIFPFNLDSGWKSCTVDTFEYWFIFVFLARLIQKFEISSSSTIIEILPPKSDSIIEPPMIILKNRK